MEKNRKHTERIMERLNYKDPTEESGSYSEYSRKLGFDF